MDFLIWVAMSGNGQWTIMEMTIMQIHQVKIPKARIQGGLKLFVVVVGIPVQCVFKPFIATAYHHHGLTLR